MTGAVAATWSARQQQLLTAMGYRLYRRLPADGAAIGPTVAGATVGEAPAWPAAIMPLARAVLAGAGRDTDAQVERLCQVWAELNLPRPDSLRDPVAKRALWPRLRALRRDRSTP